MQSVTADTNIYISAFNYRGNPRELINLANAGAIRLDLSEDIIRETVRVLVDKFGWSREGARLAEDQMRRFGNVVTPGERVDVVKEDPADNRILECARAAGSNFIVTGDKEGLFPTSIGIRRRIGQEVFRLAKPFDMGIWRPIRLSRLTQLLIWGYGWWTLKR